MVDFYYHKTGMFVQTNRPDETCLSHLRALASSKSVKDLIKANNHSADPRHSEILRLNLWLNHGVDYLHQAGERGSTSRFLVAYYGLLNLSKFMVGISSGGVVDEGHHGLSSVQSKSLFSYQAKYIQRFAKIRTAFGSLANSVGRPFAGNNCKLRLVDILLSDLSSNFIVSRGLGRATRSVAGSVMIEENLRISMHNEALRKEFPIVVDEMQVKSKCGGSQLVYHPMQVHPVCKGEMELIKSIWLKHSGHHRTQLDYLGPDGIPDKPLELLFTDKGWKQVKVGGEVDGLNRLCISRPLPGHAHWFPSLLRSFIGMWMLGDIVRYSPELMSQQSFGPEHDLQVASELFADSTISGFPVLCLGHILQKRIYFGQNMLL